ncbi:MAG: hypothetical protein LBS36_08180 [Oscillospiraceae bacterium]|jgi:predicted nucleotide-binding protein (sugar kinase/HSP70/actin superfamily)|nr:hypothetical protein [Oscillospiraceae bacterium]
MPQSVIFTFPRLGDYHIVIKSFLREIVPAAHVIVPPPVTQKTLDLGSRYSPDFICSPFKVTLGNYLEGLEQGANVLLQTGMGCRFGYYGEVQEQILRDLGYDFQFLCFSCGQARLDRVYAAMKRLNPSLNPAQFAHALLAGAKKIHMMDKFNRYMRENMAFEKAQGSFLRLQSNLYEALQKTNNISLLHQTSGAIFAAMNKIPLETPQRPLRVGVVGDLYTLMEPSSNFYLENELIKQGISVSRMMSVSFLFLRSNARSLRGAQGYLKYTVGANGVDSVCQCKRYAQMGFDGIVHMKSFGCTPEINATPALQRLSRDYKIPILHLSFDTQTSETGVQTRIEAFSDMLAMKRKAQAASAAPAFGKGERSVGNA